MGVAALVSEYALKLRTYLILVRKTDIYKPAVRIAVYIGMHTQTWAATRVSHLPIYCAHRGKEKCTLYRDAFNMLHLMYHMVFGEEHGAR